MDKRAQPLSCVTSVVRDCLGNGEEGEDDVKSAWPFDTLGYTHDTMANTMGREVARRS